MRRTSLQAGQCVFCEARQIWRSDNLQTSRRWYESAAANAARRHTRCEQPRSIGGDKGRDGGLIRKVGKAPKPQDLRQLIANPREITHSYGAGYVRLSSFQPNKKNHKSGTEKRTFREALDERFEHVERSIYTWEALENLNLKEDERKATFEAFREYVMKAVASSRVRMKLNPRAKTDPDEGAKLIDDLEQAWKSRGIEAFDTILKYAYYGHIAASKFSTTDLRNQRNLADLRYPLEWYPLTRSLKRIIHLHVGPTNSGKTYHALKALETAGSGIYAGPLRLLAHEVYTRLNAQGKRCQLVTGEERRFPDDDPNADIVSCTVEMVDCSVYIDVAVIDEIQMIGSDDRGWAWTQAFLGVRAKEVHLCGEVRTVPLIKELAAMMGDELHVHHYERLSPLEMDTHHLDGNLQNLRKGDCIVAFSVLGIHALKRSIERQTNRKVAIVYGSLPPETRAQQARLFNDPDNDYDFLVASDAVGMGINLSIKRIIFESSQKNDGISMRTLKVSEIKQIAGRAGRFRAAPQVFKDVGSTLDASPPEVQPSIEVIKPMEGPQEISNDDRSTETRRHSSSEAMFSSDSIEDSDAALQQPQALSIRGKNRRPNSKSSSSTGLVTTLYPFDFPIINNAMGLEPEPIKSAGLHPPSSIIERFTSYFPPGTPFSYILLRLNEISQMNYRFHLCGLKDSLLVADAIHPIEGLTTSDRVIICAAPISIGREPAMKGFIQSLARAIANQHGGSLLDVAPTDLPLEILDRPVSGERRYLSDMERLHKMIIIYLWLSYRFTGVFTTRQLAFYVKGLIEQRIDEALSKINFSDKTRNLLRKAREESLLKELDNAALAGLPAGVADQDSVGSVAARGDDETAEVLVESVNGEDDSEDSTQGGFRTDVDNESAADLSAEAQEGQQHGAEAALEHTGHTAPLEQAAFYKQADGSL